MMLPEFVEVGDRLFEVRIVEGPLCQMDVYAKTITCKAEQVILLSDEIEDDERRGALDRAISAALDFGPKAFRRIPVVGTIA
jgi:hypothetical protein